ncbi:unnamed protein product [Orchesella dallaii]|uniref:Uncharacterized protein n=1 Tax=Orchesella dallaii TaxID=48710 RepID=A0ABP1QA76_9HEXA
MQSRRIPREYIMFDKKTHMISIEFLLALYIRQLKNTVLQASGINEVSANMCNIIFMIPLWFGSAQRKYIKDAGLISGFENVFLINETSAIALFHVTTSDQNSNHHQHRGKRVPPTECKRILVLTENSGNVDIATYEFYCDNNGTTILEMVTCSGNLYESPRTRDGVAKNLMKVSYKSDQNFDDPKFKVFMKSLTSNLVGEALNNHPEGQSHGRSSFDVLMCTQDYRWLSIFLYAVKMWFVNVPSIVHQNKETPLTCFGNLFSDNTSFQISSQLVPDKLSELTPYTFYRRDFELRQFKDSLFEKNSKLRGDIQVVEKIRIPKASTQLILFQRNVMHGEMVVGTLEINMVAYYKYSEIETSFFVDSNGIIKFEKLYGTSFGGSEQKEVVPSTYFIWRGYNLLEFEVNNCKDLLCCVVNSFSDIERKLLETKQNVIDKCETMKVAMDEGFTHKKISSVIKKLIRRKIEQGLMFKKVNTLLELADADLDVLLSNINYHYEKYFQLQV